MALFRDNEGNFYDIPDDQLKNFRVTGEVSDGAQLSGSQVASKSNYIWGTNDDGKPRSRYIWGDSQEAGHKAKYIWGPQEGGDSQARYIWGPQEGDDD